MAARGNEREILACPRTVLQAAQVEHFVDKSFELSIRRSRRPLSTALTALATFKPAYQRDPPCLPLRVAIEPGHHVLLKMSQRSGARNGQSGRRDLQQPGQRYLRNGSAVLGAATLTKRSLLSSLRPLLRSDQMGRNATPLAVQAFRNAIPSSRRATLKLFCTATTGAMARASARCPESTLLSPR